MMNSIVLTLKVERFLDQFDKPTTMDPLGPYAQLDVDEFDEFAHEQGRPQGIILTILICLFYATFMNNIN